MNDPLDRHVRDAIVDAVTDVEPTDRLGEIRQRTARHARTDRRRWYAVGGSAVLAATVVVTVAVAVRPDDPSTRPDVSAPTSSAPPTTAPASTPPTTAPVGPTVAAALYFVNDTPDGPRLFREFQQVPEFDPKGDVRAVADALASPDDSDYRTEWPAGSVRSAQVVAGEVRVDIAADATRDPLALQQLRDTLAAATGIEELTFSQGADSFTVERDDAMVTLVSISDPTEGRRVKGAFTARGVANAPEGNVPWQLVDGDGLAVAEGSTTADGAYDRLYPWETQVDLTGVAPGNYTFVVTLDDPGAAPGAPPYVDTRVVTVEPAPPTTAYFVGPGPDGPDAPAQVLYRTTASAYGGLLDALMAGPSDPDYRTLWPAGSLVSLGDPEGGESVVGLGTSGTARPAGMSEREAELAVQQLVHTVQDHYAERPGVVFHDDVGGGRAATVLGLPADRLFEAEPPMSVYSHLLIDSPTEGEVTSGSFTAAGLANGFEGTVACRLLDPAGRTAWTDVAISGGLLDDHLGSWHLRVGLGRVSPGDYTFSCATDDPTSGAEGRGADVDTRSITVE